MNLSFHKKFVPKILNGSKIHTIREDKHNKWIPQMRIHFCTGLRTKNYDCFKLGHCITTQSFSIKHKGDPDYPSVFIDGVAVDYKVVLKLAKNDGFYGYDDFFAWFNKDFDGKIIHWTDFRYE
jgi:hypothetical protein